MAKRVTKPIKYTREFVLKETAAMLKELLLNPELFLMGELFEKRDYSPQRFSEWVDKFSDDDEISESIKKIKSIFETRLNRMGLKGDLNPTMTIFNLKNNFGWKDKSETEVTGPNGSPVFSGFDVIYRDAKSER